MAPAITFTPDAPEVGDQVTIAGTDFKKATLSTNLTGTNNDLTYTAKEWGTPSPNVTIAYVDPGVETATETVTVTGHAISVTLRSVSSVLSTAAQVAAAIVADAAASALVTVANKAANDGTGSVTALSATPLVAADLGTVDVVIHGPNESVVLENTALATNGSGAIAVPEEVEVEQPGVLRTVVTKNGVIVVEGRVQVFT